MADPIVALARGSAGYSKNRLLTGQDCVLIAKISACIFLNTSTPGPIFGGQPLWHGSPLASFLAHSIFRDPQLPLIMISILDKSTQSEGNKLSVPLLFSRDPILREAGFGPPQAENCVVFQALLRVKRFKK